VEFVNTFGKNFLKIFFENMFEKFSEYTTSVEKFSPGLRPRTADKFLFQALLTPRNPPILGGLQGF
jgi:hypothetical protein